MTVKALIEAASKVVEEAESAIEMFETYVVSAIDRTNHQVFEETGGEDASFGPTKDAIDEFKNLLKTYTPFKNHVVPFPHEKPRPHGDYWDYRGSVASHDAAWGWYHRDRANHFEAEAKRLAE
jgi:hypothetical protein